MDEASGLPDLQNRKLCISGMGLGTGPGGNQTRFGVLTGCRRTVNFLSHIQLQKYD